jgi:cbb3-type cytochrome oxidase subunit 3
MELLRELSTVVVMGTFFGVVWWAYAPSRKTDWTRKGELGEDA